MDVNNRELALLIWAAIALAFVLKRPATPLACLRVLRALVALPIRTVIALMVCHVIASIYLLNLIGWWDWPNLKLTIEWLVGFAIVTVMQIQEAERQPRFFLSILRDCVSVSAIVAFIASAYTFSLPIELLLTPLLIVAVFLATFTEGKDSQTALHRLSTTILVIVGIVILVNSVRFILSDLQGFATSKTAQDFALPVLLTVLLIPFLYGLHMYVVYENAGVRTRYSIKDKALRSYARRKMLIAFRTDVPVLRRWLRHIAVFGVTSRRDIDEAIAEILDARLREVTPPSTMPTRGWPPHLATVFLESHGLITGDYHRMPDGWHAGSQIQKLGGTVLDNTLTYYIDGTRDAVTCLTVVLSVGEVSKQDEAQLRFRSTVAALVAAAIPSTLAAGARFELSKEQPRIQLFDHQLEVKHQEWNLKGGRSYEIELTIQPLPCLKDDLV